MNSHDRSQRPAGDDQAGPPGVPGPAGPPERGKRRRVQIAVISVVTVLVLVAVVVAGHLIVSAGQSGSGAAGVSSPAFVPPREPTDLEPLFRQLTKALQARNETSFLSHVAPAARPAVSRWWANLSAIGFTTGVVAADGLNTAVQLNSEGDGTAKILAGAHSRLDPVDDSGLPLVPCEPYQIGIHQAKASAAAQITSWTQLGNAPWDQSTPLYIRTARNVEVVGYPDDKAAVDRTLAAAESAASYDLTVFRKISPRQLHQSGFIVFVSASARRRHQWFSTGPQPTGWSADPAGVTQALPGSTDFDPGISQSAVGGARVVVGPDLGSNETPVLVHEFIHDIYATDAIWAFHGHGAPTWAVEGIARFVEALYRSNPNPAPAQYTAGWLEDQLRAYPASMFHGQPPSRAQLYNGSLSRGNYFYDVAASVYLYIGEYYTVGQVFASALLAYTNDNTPFANVLLSSKGGSFTFYRPSVIEDGWRTWFVRTFG